MTNEILEIACDEAGYTGADLLHPEQRFFGFASVSIADDEAFAIIQKARQDNPVQMPELKAAKLLQSQTGRRLISSIIAAAEGRFAVNVFDKLLALGGWVFEYIYEPVYKDDPWLLYEKNLHRFVAMFVWLWFRGADDNARQTLTQFQQYMRTLDENVAPLLFDNLKSPLSDPSQEEPFEMILRFARGYKDRILADHRKELSADSWILDLTSSALWSHLNYWGQQHKPLSVNCDVSKPLKAMVTHFKGDESDPGIRRAREKGHKGHLGWKLARPIAFVDSRDHPAIQIADLIAGTAVGRLMRPVPDDFQATIESIYPHVLPDTILPDLDIINLKNRSAAVNALILYDLAQRAEQGRDPHFMLAEMYHVAEVSFARGDFNAIAKGLRKVDE